ncbi:MAG: hypothetical protein ACYTDW_01915 [Planctomycetota bacterium]|jgi:hypothetical protein
MAYEELEELEEYEGDFESEEDFYDDVEEEGIVADFEGLGDAAMAGDEDAEDEFLGALAGIAAKALPAIKTLAPIVLPKILKFGKKLLRGRSRRLVRAAPRIVRKAVRVIGRRPRVYRRRPSRIGMVLNRVTKEYIRRR